MNAQRRHGRRGCLLLPWPDPNAVLDRILLSAPDTAGEEVHAGEASEAALFRHLRGVSAMRGARSG
jgi:hypothetical protein